MLAQMTPGEKNFALRVEHLLNKISVPEYRQVNVETLMVLAQVCDSEALLRSADRNPNFQIEEYIVLDVLIGHAVRLAWLERYPRRSASYDQDKAAAWCAFYNTSPKEYASFCVKAFRFLTQIGQASAARQK